MTVVGYRTAAGFRKNAAAALITGRALLASSIAALLLAGCAAQQPQLVLKNGRYFDSKLGVYASDKVVADGDAVPRGGGSYLTGRPYVIGGRSYVPQQNPAGYVSVGTASWYGDAFHGRRTANGEVFDKSSVSAAHPTLPLPSYVRVTNLNNNHSMIVRVNDRGPYHGGRVMDVSQRVAETLDFRRAGTARIRVEYVGRASLGGSDDEKLMATLRTDGGAAHLAGFEDDRAGGTAVASLSPSNAPVPSPPPGNRTEAAARAEEAPRRNGDENETLVAENRGVTPPLPPARPFDVGTAAPGADHNRLLRRPRRDRVASANGR